MLNSVGAEIVEAAGRLDLMFWGDDRLSPQLWGDAATLGWDICSFYRSSITGLQTSQES